MFLNSKKKFGKCTILQALVRIVGFDKLQAVLPEVKTKRDLLSTTAKVLNFSDRLLLKSVAAELKLPVSELVNPCFSKEVARYGGIDFFRNLAAVPIFSGSKLTAVICVDPELIKASNLEVEQVYLNTWENISKALDLSTIGLEQDRLDFDANELDQACEHIFRKLILEVASLQAKEINFNIDYNDCRYEFITQANKRGGGTIADFMVKPLENYLSKLLVKFAIFRVAEHDLELSFDSEANSFKVKFNSNTEPLLEIKQDIHDRVENDANIIDELERLEISDKTVLIVEDSLIFAEVLTSFLEKMKLKVLKFKNGQVALDWLANNSRNVPDLIITDLYMPIMDGFSLIASLKADHKFKNIKIIVLTSDEASDTELKSLELGADLVIKKSADPKLLFTHIHRLLRMDLIDNEEQVVNVF